LVEAHFLDFQGDLVGRSVELYFLERLRDERRFPSPSDLVAQIHADIEAVRHKTIDMACPLLYDSKP
jgi:riboflavin kinase/FMN adenylyltransferase